MYHDVYSHDIHESGFFKQCDLPYKVSSEKFENEVKAISDYCKSNNIHKEFVTFTFDDGGKSFNSVIAPILQKYGYKGVFFISTKFIGTETFLNESEIIELHKAGHIIGSHAHSHEHLYQLTDEQVDEEWKTSIIRLSEIIKEPVIYASIPNGDMDKRVIATVQKYGVKYLYTSEPTTKIIRFKDMKVFGRYVILSDYTTENVVAIITSPCKRIFLSCKRNILKLIKFILGENYMKLKNIILH